MANQRELACRFHLEFARRLNTVSALQHLRIRVSRAIWQDHEARFGPAKVRICRVLARGGVDQRSACLGTDHAYRPPQLADGGGAAGRNRDTDGLPSSKAFQLALAACHQALVLEQLGQYCFGGHDFAEDVVEGRLQDLDAFKRHIQLFGNKHGQRGIHALTHFASRHRQLRITCGGQFDPAVECDVVVVARR